MGSYNNIWSWTLSRGECLEKVIQTSALTSLWSQLRPCSRRDGKNTSGHHSCKFVNFRALKDIFASLKIASRTWFTYIRERQRSRHFTKDLFSRNFAYAKFLENKTLAKFSEFTDYVWGLQYWSLKDDLVSFETTDPSAPQKLVITTHWPCPQHV